MLFFKHVWLEISNHNEAAAICNRERSILETRKANFQSVERAVVMNQTKNAL
jgi:hypothetical protein